MELGLNSDLGSYFDPINVVFRTKHLNYKKQIDGAGDEQAEAKEALDTTLIRLNDSYLSRLCKKELPSILKGRLSWRLEETRGKYAANVARELRNGLIELGNALEKCEAISEKGNTKNQCRNVVISLGAQYRLRLGQDAVGTRENVAPQLSDLYWEIQEGEKLAVVDLATSWDNVKRVKAKVDAEPGLGRNIGVPEDREELRAMKARFDAQYSALSKEREEVMKGNGNGGESFRVLGREALELASREAGMAETRERVKGLQRRVRVLRTKYDGLKKGFEKLIQQGQLYVGAHEHIRAMAAGQPKES